MRFSDYRPIDTLRLPFLVDAAAPAVLELGATGSVTIQLTSHLRARPSSEWVACRHSTRHLVHGLHEEDIELWDINGQLVAQGRQLAVLPSSHSSDA